MNRSSQCLSRRHQQIDAALPGGTTLRDGASMTSQLWAADSDGRWIRSLTRFYRLGAAFHNHTSRPQSDSDGGL
jgi:hypothetical protein